MSLSNQIIGIIACYILLIFFERYILCTIKHYLFNNSAYKKYSKGESIRENILYSRYLKLIPKKFIIPYYIVLIIHPLLIFFCIVCNLIEVNNLSMYVTKIVLGVDLTWFLILILARRFTDLSKWLPQKHKKGNRE